MRIPVKLRSICLAMVEPGVWCSGIWIPCSSRHFLCVANIDSASRVIITLGRLQLIWFWMGRSACAAVQLGYPIKNWETRVLHQNNHYSLFTEEYVEECLIAPARLLRGVNFSMNCVASFILPSLIAGSDGKGKQWVAGSNHMCVFSSLIWNLYLGI